jgi:hypothetical protein
MMSVHMLDTLGMTPCEMCGREGPGVRSVGPSDVLIEADERWQCFRHRALRRFAVIWNWMLRLMEAT